MATRLRPETKLRRSAALVVTFENGAYSVTNYLRRRSFTCNALCLELLAGASSWRDVARFQADLKSYAPASVTANLAKLVDGAGLVVQGSPEAKDDDAYAAQWEWGP